MTLVFARNGIDLAYTDTGAGMPVLFQHGLGGDNAQVADTYPEIPQTRRITLECRGQGGSAFGPLDALSIKTLAEDILALADSLGIGTFAAGGISMGAAIAAHLAVHHPDRVSALMLARPAWITDAAPANLRPYGLAGELLLRHDPVEARRLFECSETAAELRRLAPDNLASLMGFFTRPEPKKFGALLTAIAADGPGVTEGELRSICVPTLIIGHENDLAHPLASARRLAAIIPNALLKIITPKAVDKEKYRQDFRRDLSGFFAALIA